MKYYPYYILLFVFLLTSCIKDEEANKECDILSAWVEGDQYKEWFYQPETDMRINEVLYTNNTITFTVKSIISLPKIPLHFNITPGATIQPANGSEQDFKDGPVTYTVTSQDGSWKREYKVIFREAEFPTDYNFENFELTTYDIWLIKCSYYTWYEFDSKGNKINLWATGNQGFGMGNSNLEPEKYPTVPDANGYEGKCVKMQTLNAGKMAEAVHKYIAAGNLFIGAFDVNLALTNSLASTKMGKNYTFTTEPIKVTGYYKYQPGAEYRDAENNVVPNKTDEADAYAVLYRNVDEEGNPIVLDGGNVLNSKYVVSKARVESLPPTNDWKPFEMVFKDVAPINPDILSYRGYNLALVFSSSKEGAKFCGAIGSTLYIDKVAISLEKE